jgi:hypothetical protein
MATGSMAAVLVARIAITTLTTAATDSHAALAEVTPVMNFRAQVGKSVIEYDWRSAARKAPHAATSSAALSTRLTFVLRENAICHAASQSQPTAHAMPTVRVIRCLLVCRRGDASAVA